MSKATNRKYPDGIKSQADRQTWDMLCTIPKRIYVLMSGRKSRTSIDRQAAEYGIPCSGSPISLPSVIEAFHDLLAEHGPRILRGDDPDALMIGGGNSPWLEKYREERARLAQLDRLERQGQLLRRDTMHEQLTRLASILRNAGETLQREYGPDAAGVLNEAIEDYKREIVAIFGTETPNTKELNDESEANS